MNMKASVLSEPGGLWRLTFALGQLENLPSFTQSYTGYPRFYMFRAPASTTWPVNNCLQIMICSWAMSSNCVWLLIIFCFYPSCDRSEVKMADRFTDLWEFKKQTCWSNDNTVIELGHHKILWFVTVSQINNLPQPLALANNWSACHWQITIFC